MVGSFKFYVNLIEVNIKTLINNLSVKFKIIISSLFLVIFALSTVSIYSYISIEQNTLELLGEKLERIASTGSLLISANDHHLVYLDYIKRKQDIDKTKHFKRLQQTLKKIKNVNKLSTDVYTLILPKWAKDKMVFLVMDNDETYVGNSVDVNPYALKAFESKKAINTPIYGDEEGKWMSAFSPILNKKNEVIALLEINFKASGEIQAQKLKIINSLLISLVLATFLSIFFGLYVGTKLSQPIISLSQKSRLIAEGNLEINIPQLKRKDEIGALYRNFSFMLSSLKDSQQELEDYNLNLEKIVAQRTDQLNQNNHILKTILDSLDQGILLFDMKGSCQPHFSKACLDILEVNPENKNIADILKEDTESFHNWIDTLFQEFLPFDEMKLAGPKKYQHSKEKMIELKYQDIRDEENKVSGVVLVATDKTQEKIARNEARKRKDYIDMIFKILKNPDQLPLFINEASKRINLLKDLLNEESPIDVNILYLHMHTIKGGAANLSIVEMAEVCHDLETKLTQTGIGNKEKLSYFLDKVNEIEKLLNNFIDQVDSILGKDYLNEEEILVNKKMLSRFIEALPIQRQEEAYQEFFHQSLYQSLGNFNETIQELAQREMKLVKPLEINGVDKRVSLDVYGSFIASLVHYFRNIVDHGIEDPMERQEIGKEAEGKVSIQLESLNNDKGEFLSIVIKDDGRGIDLNKLKNKVKGHHFSSDHDLIQSIFLEQVSTRDEVTQLSGRGVGMGAIKYEVDKLSGTIEVSSVEGEGMELKVLLPLETTKGQLKAS